MRRVCISAHLGIIAISVLWLSWTIATVDSFSVQPVLASTAQRRIAASGSSWDGDDEVAEDILLGTDEIEKAPDLPFMEQAWRYAKKPLLRIGSKGATSTHGNSLRQLLEAHTVVKVKINTGKLGNMQDAFEVLKGLAEEAGAAKGIELIQAREGDKVIMFGMAGTLDKIEKQEFPPPVEVYVPRSESDWHRNQ